MSALSDVSAAISIAMNPHMRMYFIIIITCQYVGTIQYNVQKSVVLHFGAKIWKITWKEIAFLLWLNVSSAMLAVKSGYLVKIFCNISQMILSFWQWATEKQQDERKATGRKQGIKWGVKHTKIMYNSVAVTCMLPSFQLILSSRIPLTTLPLRVGPLHLSAHTAMAIS